MTVHSPLRHLLLLALACVFLSTGGVLLRTHAAVIRDIGETVLPVAAQIPVLERRSHLLKEQAELAELKAALEIGSSEEELHVYVLPKGAEAKRTVALLDLLRQSWQERGMLGEHSPLEVLPSAEGEPDSPPSTLLTQQMALRPDALQELLTIVRLSGLITVSDALPPLEIEKAFAALESGPPSAASGLEQYFSRGLLTYVRNQRSADDRLRQAFSADSGSAVLTMMQRAPLLTDAKQIFSGELGGDIAAEDLWPFQFLRVEHLEVEKLSGDWLRVSVELRALGRSA